MFPKCNFIGLGVDILTYTTMLDQFDKWIIDKQSRSKHVACVNVNCAAEGILNPEIMKMFNHADIVGADGMPFVYWIRFIKKNNCDRLYAPDIILEIGKQAAKKAYRIYLYGGAEGTPDKMKNYLEQKFPGIQIVGHFSPPFRKLTDREDDEICKMINDTNPDFIFVGLGSPKQDMWIQAHLDKIPGTVMIASGATFDFFSGTINQSPEWIQKSGFEWLFRLFSDPKRLWKRYTLFNLIFIWCFLLQLLKIKKYKLN